MVTGTTCGEDSRGGASANSFSVQITSWTASSVNASIRSMTENGNSTLVSTKTRAMTPELSSVREVGGLDRVGNPPPASTAPLPTRLEAEHIGQPDHPVPAVG